MVYFKRILITVSALALSFAVHTANFYFYTSGASGSVSEHVDQMIEVNDKTMSYLFPYVEVESVQGGDTSSEIAEDSSSSDVESESAPESSSPPVSTIVPSNMTYSDEEFLEFSDTYLFETENAGDEYIKGITFCGDSLTYGMGIDSRYLGACDVVAWGGLGVYDFLDYNKNTVYNQSEELKTSLEWLKEINPSVIYIMLGTNGIAIWANDFHTKLYGRMLDRIEDALPKAKIVLIGIPAWASFKNTETFNGQKVDNYNMMLLELAHSRGHYYLNFAEVTRDETGNFSQDLCAGDGIHWKNACKTLFIDYVKTHAIKK